jgi:phosphatidylinositol alpha-1,6-mannosyltransferase
MNVVMDNISARGADRIIAISEEMRKQLCNYYRIDESAITRISHGVDTDRYRPRGGDHEAVSDDKLTLLFVGRLISRKGVNLAIEGLAAADSDNVELIIAGTGRLKQSLQQLARDCGVADRVSFLGYIPDEELPVLYSSVDATVFTSNYEGFGLVFLESLAAGTPVIGTRVGGLPDLVTDGQEGFLIKRSPAALGRAIEKLADTPSRTEEMGRYARELAETRTWNDVAVQTEAVYESAVR